MRFLHLRLLVSSLIVVLASTASAGQKVDIYRADTLVKTQSESERNAAARATFGEVIVRVSGQRSALDHPAIKAAQSSAQNYLFGFTYKSSPEKITVDGKTFPALSLQLNYEPQAIEKLLRDSQLPLWPVIRPKVLVWLVAKDSTGLRLVPEATDLQAMQLQAQYRGLPVSFPKLDLEDSLSLTADDLWALDIEKIKTASLRYKADAILIGRYTPYSLGPIPPAVVVDPLAAETPGEETAASSLSSSSTASSMAVDGVIDAAPAPANQGPWLGDWQLLHASSDQAFADETPEVKGLFTAAIDHAADYFANHYAIVPTNQGPQTIVLRVGGITGFGQFKQAQAYLDELAMVQRMEVVKVDAEGMLVRLTTDGDVKLLMSTLALGRRLAPLQSDTLVDTPAGAVVADQAPVVVNDTGLDAEALAELDQALANEQIPDAAAASSPQSQLASPQPQLPLNTGTAENPLIYVWQK